MMHERFT
jgi:hypothetical protein